MMRYMGTQFDITCLLVRICVEIARCCPAKQKAMPMVLFINIGTNSLVSSQKVLLPPENLIRSSAFTHLLRHQDLLSPTP